MKRINNVFVIGLGAIGASYAAKLYDMDPECVTIIADKERIERYSREPLSVNGKTYNFKYVEPHEKALAPDLILVAVKYHHLQQTIEDIRDHVGKDTIVMSLLNGIDSEDMIAEKLGIGSMIYSTCVAIDAVRKGNSIKYSTFGRLEFGEKLNTTHSQRVESLKELFDRAGIPYVIPEDMLKALWWKYMLNIGVNQVSAVLRAPYGAFQKVQGVKGLMADAMREVAAVSKKLGIELTEEDIERADKTIGLLSPEGKTSMLQDVEAGRKTEVRMFAGVLCMLGEKYGVETPVNNMLLKIIEAIEGINMLKS